MYNLLGRQNSESIRPEDSDCPRLDVDGYDTDDRINEDRDDAHDISGDA
jgi:hypothetical protein